MMGFLQRVMAGIVVFFLEGPLDVVDEESGQQQCFKLSLTVSATIVCNIYNYDIETRL